MHEANQKVVAKEVVYIIVIVIIILCSYNYNYYMKSSVDDRDNNICHCVMHSFRKAGFAITLHYYHTTSSG
jgi:hypothetical protein